MIWLISDEHYGHENIIRHCGRPFTSAEQMDAAMLSAMQKDVGAYDLVYHLGDFCAYGPVPAAVLLHHMPGTHVLVRGNHDRGPVAMANIGFAAVVEEAVVSYLGRRLLLRHRPLYEPLPKGITGVLHGHVHNGKASDLEEAGEPSDIPTYNLNLSVEKTNYRPVSIKTALRLLSRQKRGEHPNE